MKILDLHLKAFGLFTDRVLDLSAGEQGLHLIFGENEAGKSTALRGLHGLLFGIPERTPDTFLHGRDLRVGGRLRHSDGSEIAILRRKGRKKTLLSLDGDKPLDEVVLEPYLQGLTMEVFSTLFAIDHQELVSGGKELLKEGGAVGRALFSASLGTVNLRGVLHALEAEADELFRPRGSKPLINQAVAEFKEARKAIKAASLPGREWLEQQNKLRRADGALRDLDERVKNLRNRLNRLRRQRTALPLLTERKDVLDGLADLGEVAQLAGDFGDRRQEAEQELRIAQERRSRAEATTGRLKERLAGLRVSEAILEHAEQIDDLHQRLGAHRKAAQDRPDLERQQKEHQAAASDMLAQIDPSLGLEDAAPLRLALRGRTRVQKLGTDFSALTAERKAAARNARKARLKLEGLEEQLALLPQEGDRGALELAVREARKAGDVTGELETAREGLRTEQREVENQLSSLGLWEGSLEEVEGLPAPLTSTINRFEERFQDLAVRRRDLDKETKATEERLAAARRDLEQIRLGLEVPSEEDLLESRRHRDEGWGLLKRKWIENDDVTSEARSYAPDLDLHEAYEKSVGGSDEIADRLRREAERVHRRAELLADRDECERGLGALEGRGKDLGEETERLEGEWQAVWMPCGIDPLAPREMNDWSRRLAELKTRVGSLQKSRERVAILEADVQKHEVALRAPLEGFGLAEEVLSEDLPRLLDQCEQLLTRLDERVRLEKSHSELKRDLSGHLDTEKEGAAALERWRKAWTEAVEPLGLAANALPEEAAEQIARITEFLAHLKDADGLGKRLYAIRNDTQEFEEGVRALAVRIAPELADMPGEEVVTKLKASLDRNREQASERKNLSEQLDKAEEEIEKDRNTIEAMEKRLATLRRIAGCERNEELVEAERRLEERQRLAREQARIEKQLVDCGEGLTIQQLSEEAQDADRDSLPGQIGAIEAEIAEADERRRELYSDGSDARAALRAMDGGSSAAEAAESAQEILARLRAAVERYARTRIATKLLEGEIERYREAHQDPLLRRAGRFFADLTLGSFSGLGIDFDEKDRPVIVGLRNEDDRVPVAGLSDGSEDQLYFALRLAAIERYAETSEPVPFIVDDVLIGFDDRRTKAALEVLADLSAHTQVVLFTHHRNVADLARELGETGGVFVQELD
jgi:uncharacterized protein YhaN